MHLDHTQNDCCSLVTFHLEVYDLLELLQGEFITSLSFFIQLIVLIVVKTLLLMVRRLLVPVVQQRERMYL